MNIEKKIEEIRKQPEHIRIRYVIGGVVVSMLFILIIWIASLKQTFQGFQTRTEEGSALNADKLFEGIDRTREEIQSLEEVLQNTPTASEGNDIPLVKEAEVTSQESSQGSEKGENFEVLEKTGDN